MPSSRFNCAGDGHQHWCRECFRRYFRNRGDLHRKQSGEAHKRRRATARDYVKGILAKSCCADCGESDSVVMEFDHLGPKLGDISQLRQDGLGIERLRQEIAGCEVVCVNCHRHRTAERCLSWRLDPRRLATKTPGERRNYEHIRDVLMRSGCIDCGTWDLVALDFDHIGPKTANVIELARSGVGLARLKREIEQCEVRCANCHRRRTIKRLAEVRDAFKR